MNRMTRRGPWLPEEDRTLLHLVQTQGANNWVRISQQLQHRSPKQCRERYHQNLKPSLKHEPISPQEGEIIEQMVADMGKRWAEIARHLGNRSDNAVKNWWNGSMNRRRRNLPQASTGFKQMGPRPQPIPFTNANRTSYAAQTAPSLHRDNHNLAHPSMMRQHSPRMPLPSPTHPPPPLTRPPTASSPPYQLSLDQRRGYGPSQELQYPYPAYREAYSTTSRHAPQGGPLLAAHDQQNPSTREFSRPPLLQPRQDLPPLRPAAYLIGSEAEGSTQEPPLISPVLSDKSQSVRQPPSLVSDNLSTCSISPKTVTSPHLNIHAAMDLSTQQFWQHQHQHQPQPPSTEAKSESRTDHVLPGEITRAQLHDALPDTSKTKDSRMHLSSLLR